MSPFVAGSFYICLQHPTAAAAAAAAETNESQVHLKAGSH